MRIESTILVPGLPDGMDAIFARVGEIAIRLEQLDGAYEAGFTLTDDAGIKEINREQRGMDRPTDVLSFPSVQFRHGTARDNPKKLRQEYSPETGCIYLGDIVISLPRAEEQAQAYGHSLVREIAFLFVHGTLHLMGYDHETEEQRMCMRAMEEEIMNQSGISRELTDADFALVEGAKEAMTHAYAPYSKYRVGACVRTTDGKIHKGCNVENASFGMTICAERNAMTTAVTEGMHGIEAIAIAAEGPMPYPCGACRQFMREFAKDMKVILVNGDNIEVTTLQTLLPDSFGPESIEEVNA